VRGQGWKKMVKSTISYRVAVKKKKKGRRGAPGAARQSVKGGLRLEILILMAVGGG